MKWFTLATAILTTTILNGGMETTKMDTASKTQPELKILYLHHSTGGLVWKGGLPELLGEKCPGIVIKEQAFPKSEPYGWRNYPYDYWNIWVKHGGDQPYKDEPTLEMLVPEYDVIIFKHCFPVSHVQPDTGSPDIQSDRKSLENYKLQYAALKEKLNSFPETTFIVWTSAALVEGVTSTEEGQRSREFVEWVRDSWDTPADNVHIWDFFELETEGGLFLKPNYAASEKDSHPNAAFSKMAAACLANRIHHILAGKGDGSSLTGK